MQLLHDFLPVLLFFAVYRAKDIYWATGALIVALALQTGVQWVRHRKVSTMALVSLGLVVVFGGLTLLLRDERFIQWKVTIVNGLFAVAFLVSPRLGGKPIVERMLEAQLRMEPLRWRQLNLVWVGFFVFLGALNVAVMHTVPLETWVKFKTFGLLGLTVAFVLAQGVWLSQHAQEVEAPKAPGSEPAPAPAAEQPAPEPASKAD